MTTTNRKRKPKLEETLERFHTFLKNSPEHLNELSQVSPQKRFELIRQGFLDHAVRPYDWIGWDDTFNKPVGDRTVAQVGLDWLMYLQNQPEKYHIWLFGDPGMGKTHLACVLAVLWFIAQDTSIAYCNWAQKLAQIRQSYGGGQTAGDLETERRARILVLDDMGAERTTLWSLEMLYDMLEDRRGRPTIYTSNFAVKDYTKRLYSSHRRDDDQVAVEMLAAKIDDRLSFGVGGYLLSEINFDSDRGSYRRLVHG